MHPGSEWILPERSAIARQRTLPARPWEETRSAYEARLKDIVRTINARFDVEGLTHEFPERIDSIIDAEGGRIAK